MTIPRTRKELTERKQTRAIEVPTDGFRGPWTVEGIEEQIEQYDHALIELESAIDRMRTRKAQAKAAIRRLQEKDQ